MEITGRILCKLEDIMDCKYPESVRCKHGFTFINTPQYGSGISGFVTFNMRSLKEEEVILSITYHTGVKGHWLG